MKKAVVFIHIPKTAGTTLARVFKENYVFWPKGRVYMADPVGKEQKLAAMFGDFQKSRQELDGITTRLVKIGEEIGDQQANKIWSTVERILFGAVLCRTTSEILKIAAYVEVDSLSNYFAVLNTHLVQGKGQLTMQYNGLKGYSACVQDKTALWELDKAQQVMRSSLESYDKALSLLPSAK